jgi:23S rRNA (cytosine1962-C5)-methyltransferase
MSNQIPKLWLRNGRETPLLAGHPWIFSKGIETGPIDESGKPVREVGLVKVYSGQKDFLGIGMYNPNTSISVRMISLHRDDEKDFKVDRDFFVRKFKSLEGAKKEFLAVATTAYRLVNADADWLPGLIMDRYENIFVFQIHTAAMDKYRDLIVEALKEAFDPEAIVERSDIDSRKADGLASLPVKIHYGKVSGPVEFCENGVKFLADVLGGQKTGFFLDQRDSRKRVGELARGKRVLNLFSYTGGFGLYAALNGAAKVTTIDASEPALELAQENFRLNGIKIDDKKNFDKYDFICADVFDFLSSINIGDYDLIVCDPPAFAKSNDKIDVAKKAYTSVNRRCMDLLSSGGILVTCSCSGRITQEDFRDILRFSAGRSKKDMRVLSALTQPFDHTERVSFPEGRYLKTFVLQCLDHF